jgi:uncharacterized protein YxeA
MKRNIIGVIAFVAIIIFFNLIIYYVSTNRKEDFLKSLDKIQGVSTGAVVSKDSIEQNVGLIKLNLYQTDLENFNLTEEGFTYLTIKGNEAELIVSYIGTFEIGDPVILDADRDLCITFRQGIQVNKIEFKKLFIYRRSPVYHTAKWKKTLD